MFLPFPNVLSQHSTSGYKCLILFRPEHLFLPTMHHGAARHVISHSWKTTNKMAAADLSFDKWQLKAATLRERNEYMFNNELLSDIHFLVGRNKVKVPAHKYVLAISTPVFFAMLHGQMAEKSSEIKITDSEPEAFLELLRFIYTDETILTLDNVLGTLYLAKKYILPVLAERCVEFIDKSVNPENVLTVLSHSRYLGEEELEEKCWSVVDLFTSRVLESEHFVDLDEESLCKLLGRNTIAVKEIILFHAVQEWAAKECGRQFLGPTAENQKTVASKALKLIRYPLMSPVEFADEVARSGLLTHEETTNIFLFFLSSYDTELLFNENPRVPRSQLAPLHKQFRFARFRSCCGNDWFCDTRKYDGIKFTTDRSVYIKGIGLYGASKVEGEYKISAELCHQNKVLAQTKKSYSSTTQSFVHDIIFDQSVLIEKGQIYSVNVLIRGPCSLSGTDGMKTVTCENVRFTFMDYTSPNGTALSAGQIPELIFHL